MSADDHKSSSPVIFLDGGLGTSLEDNYAMHFDHSTPLWSSHLLVQDQETLLACQKDFGDVPSDIILTATYQISIEGFAKTCTSEFPRGITSRAEIAGFVRDAIRIANQAGELHEGKVALSVGPYGACMMPSQEYSGKYDPAHDSLLALQKWHAERLRIFKVAGGFLHPVSFVAVETIPRFDEIIAIRRALGETNVLENATPFWISCLYPGDEDALPDSTSAQEAVKAMLDPELAQCLPWGIGINCTKMWKLERLIGLYESAVAELYQKLGHNGNQLALVLYPDGTTGEVYNTTIKTWVLPGCSDGEQRPLWEDQLADIVQKVRSRGRWKQVVAGGCCKTSHAHLSRLRQRVQARDNGMREKE